MTSDWRESRANRLAASNQGSNYRCERKVWRRLVLELLEDRILPSFLAPSSFPAEAGNLISVNVADVNHDGVPDIVAVGYQYDSAGDSNGVVNVFLGNGDGTFQAPLVSATEPLVNSAVVADFNGDGVPDLAVATNHIDILLGNADGTFRPPDLVNAGNPPQDLGIGDFNGDGVPDLVTDAGIVLLGNGDGTFRSPIFNYPLGTQLAVADLNGAGTADLVSVARGGNGFWVSLGNGDGTFQPAVQYSTLANARVVQVADVNGDGIPDVVTGNGGALGISLGNGDGTFQPARTFSQYPSFSALAVGDFNGDGIPDLVTVTASYPNGSVNILLETVAK